MGAAVVRVNNRWHFTAIGAYVPEVSPEYNHIRPTEQAAVSLPAERRARRVQRQRSCLSRAGIKEPLSPPTEELAIAPPFFTASFNKARAAVVPWRRNIPTIASRYSPLSPAAGVGARKSTMPKECQFLRYSSSVALRRG